MTYYVSSGTLNPTHSLTHSLYRHAFTGEDTAGNGGGRYGGFKAILVPSNQ